MVSLGDITEKVNMLQIKTSYDPIISSHRESLQILLPVKVRRNLDLITRKQQYASPLFEYFPASLCFLVLVVLD